MNDSGFLELSNDAGLIATIALTFNFLLGMLLATAYKRSRFWKMLPQIIQRVDVNSLHNWTAYVALLIAVMHPLLLLLAPSTKFSLLDMLFPVNAPHQKIFVACGTLSIFAIATVVITTQKAVKSLLSFRIWKNIHLISYGTAILFVVHGVAMDPQLKDRPVDYFDGEKVLSELCAVILIIAGILRYRHFMQMKKQTMHRESFQNQDT
jgi:sulfoxide reductase heme-binding subunit YedZ